jgi:hypothetical protein
MQSKWKIFTILSLVGSLPLPAKGFLQNDGRRILHKVPSGCMQPSVEEVGRRPQTLLMASLWERLDVEEDSEPMWYVLNCVAGVEMALLGQCRQNCEGMEDVEKFVVPTITTTRSHGANRMVQDTKVKYQGYVFAKLRLCKETYETIQGTTIFLHEDLWTERLVLRITYFDHFVTRIGSLPFLDGYDQS